MSEIETMHTGIGRIYRVLMRQMGLYKSGKPPFLITLIEVEYFYKREDNVYIASVES